MSTPTATVDKPANLPADKPPVVERTFRRGRAQDTQRRRALERYAVRLVSKRFADDGYAVADVGDRESWDLTLTRGATQLHVEVKGSSATRDGIELTDGEVRHAERHNTLLAVVDEIVIDADYACTAGRLRIWPGWIPSRADLVATSYRYLLPTRVLPEVEIRMKRL